MSRYVEITGKPLQPAQIDRIAREEALRAAHEAVDVLAHHVEQSAPKGPTKKLGRNLAKRAAPTKNGVSVSVRPKAEYAEMVDSGTGVYAEHHSAWGPKRVGGRPRRSTRNPKHAGALPAGRFGFRARIKGQKAQRFIARADAAAEQELLAVFDRAAARVGRRVGG